MIIRKMFKFEAAHIVRNAVSERCKYSIHGHSYKVEIFIQGSVDKTDGMVLDFIQLKESGVHSLVDMFDHAIVLWSDDCRDYIEDMKHHSKRAVVMSENPTAENMATFFHHHIQKIVDKWGLKVKSIRVHETDTGYAESEESDLINFNPAYEVFS